MKKCLLVLVAILAGVVYANEPSTFLPPRELQSPQLELAELQAKIVSSKEAGIAIDPAWQARAKELVHLIKGHPGALRTTPADVPNTCRTLEQDGFENATVIRPQELSPLEQQIKDLEYQLSGGESPFAPDQVTIANLKEELNTLYAQRPQNQPRRNPLDQGNDVCPPTSIPGVPYTDTGTTAGMGNDFNPINPCNPSGSNDVIYSFTPFETKTYRISLMGSSYDTYLYVNTTGPCPGTVQVACNDDAFGTAQSFVSVTLNAGQTYYIIVDGYDTNRQGLYALTVTDECDIECLPTDLVECPETVSPFHNVDDCDGGCNNTNGSPTWHTLQLSQTVCGRGFTYINSNGSNARDTDFYIIQLTEPCSLIVTVNSEFPISFNIHSSDLTCPVGTFWYSQSWSFPCSTATFITPCLPAGTYSLFVGSQSGSGVPIPREYRLRVDPIPCSGCRVDAYLQAPGSAAWNTCGAGNDNSLRPSPDYTYLVNIPYESDWTFSICNDDSIWDSYIYLSTQCNDSVIAEDDDECGNVGLSVINCVPLTPGAYYLTIEGFTADRCGPFVLNVTECLGSCCYGDPGSPGCDFVNQTDCDTLGGLFTQAEPCSTGACFTRPVCDDAGSLFSQLPMLPDEPWSTYLSDADVFFYSFEDYSVSEPIGRVKFWGYFADPACNDDTLQFQIVFIDSVNNLTETRLVTLTGTTLTPAYEEYNAVEYVAEINPPCSILDGYVRVANIHSPACEFYWLLTIEGNGTNAVSGDPPATPNIVNDGELAFCLGSACPSADSLTITTYDGGITPNAYTLRWWQPEGYVVAWWTNNPNGTFPADYDILFASGDLPEGSYPVSFITPDLAADEVKFVLTMECAPFLTQPTTDPQIQVIKSPFAGHAAEQK